MEPSGSFFVEIYTLKFYNDGVLMGPFVA